MAIHSPFSLKKWFVFLDIDTSSTHPNSFVFSPEPQGIDRSPFLNKMQLRGQDVVNLQWLIGYSPFLGGFLVELSCPLTSCNLFSSSRFFSKASSSFVFPTGFLMARKRNKDCSKHPSFSAPYSCQVPSSTFGSNYCIPPSWELT